MEFFTKLKKAGANPQTINDGQYVVFEHEVDGTINLVVANAKTEENLLVVKKPVSSIKEAERGIEVTYADGENDVYLETGFWLSELAVPGMSFGNESQSSEDDTNETEIRSEESLEAKRAELEAKQEARRAELEAKQAARRAEFEAKQEARKANQRVTFDAITRGVYPLTLGNVMKAFISLFL